MMGISFFCSFFRVILAFSTLYYLIKYVIFLYINLIKCKHIIMRRRYNEKRL